MDAIDAKEINLCTEVSKYDSLSAVYDTKVGGFVGPEASNSRLNLDLYAPSFGTANKSSAYLTLTKNLDCIRELYTL